ncbi:tetratricopeptide repeat protein (macronuclear) [Tetrahymena thermophila SB210]|uniref:Tetratricopeptide repeat protein n=1 Tax=Tetrahymena thermophila (strain SB210) TaxID=312017 RepID=W7X9Q8_TETTS|nr:tetratricopeptide repeat protein [Tetrahymena thermophila SB210]EWS73133.1 tetratricopeptide repeat protein [Tetrahymena thermophila SB210]|eukprot:XP_012654320.1 tetratricopeptide repeat protein [Tetrahymena thermophila SB210]
MKSQNTYYLNEWYFKNITNIISLSEDQKQDLLQYDLGGTFMQFIIKSIDLQYNSSQFTSFQLAKVNSGIFYFTPAYNYSLASIKNPRNCQYSNELYYDVRCSNWFQNTFSQNIIQYPNPYLLGSQIKVGMCQNLLNDSSSKHSVICQIYNLNQLFPDTQQVVYDKNNNITYQTSPYTLRELLKRYEFDDQTIDYIMSKFPQSYFKTHQNYSQGDDLGYFGLDIQTGIFGLQVECQGVKKYINAYQGNVTYYQNGQQYTDNIFVNFSIIDYDNIQNLSETMQKTVYRYNVNTFIIGLLLSSIVLIFTIISTIQITNKFLNSLDNLIQILNTLHETKENSCLLVFEDEIINQIIDQKNIFLFAKEFYELFESFEILLQTLKYASLQLTSGNKDNSLLSWSMAVKFFQATNHSHRALGICWNNIGMIHFQQKRYIEAAQAFQSAIIQADYELGFYDDMNYPFNFDINENILVIKFKRIYSYQLSIKKWMKRNQDISVWKEYKQIMINLGILAENVPQQVNLNKLVIALNLVDSLIDSKQALKAQKYINSAFISFKDYQKELQNSDFDNLNQNKRLSLSKSFQSSVQLQRKRAQSQNSPSNIQSRIQPQNSRITYQNSLFSNQSPFLSNQKHFFPNQNISILNQNISSSKRIQNQNTSYQTNLFEQSPLFISNQKIMLDTSYQNENHKNCLLKVQKKLSDSLDNSKNSFQFCKNSSGQNKQLYQINENLEQSYNSFCKSSTSSLKIQSEDSFTQLNYFKSISFHEKKLLVQKRFKPQSCVGDQHFEESQIGNESKQDIDLEITKPLQKSLQPVKSIFEYGLASKQIYITWFRNKMIQHIFQNKNKQERQALLTILNEDIDYELNQNQDINNSQLLSQKFKSFNKSPEFQNCTTSNKEQTLNSPDIFFSKIEKKKQSLSNLLKRKIMKIIGSGETSNGNKSSNQIVLSKQEGSKKYKQNEKESKLNLTLNQKKTIKISEPKYTKAHKIKSQKADETQELKGNTIWQSQNINPYDSFDQKSKNNNIFGKKNIQEIPECIFNSMITFYQANVMFVLKNFTQAAELLTQIFEQNQTSLTYLNSKVLKLLLQIIKNSKLSLLPIYSIQSSYGQFSLNLSFLIDCNQQMSQFQASKIISSTVLKILQEPNDRFNIHLNNKFQTTLVKDLSAFKDKYAIMLELKNLFQNIIINFDKEKRLYPDSKFQKTDQENISNNY